MNAPHRRKEWQEFKDWCGQRGLKAFPAHPWTLSAYMLWLEAHRRYRTLHKRMDVIARVHLRACAHSPERDSLVQRTLKAIEYRRENPQNRAFNGKELLEPKKSLPKVNKQTTSKRSLRHVPPLVARRPQPDA